MCAACRLWLSHPGLVQACMLCLICLLVAPCSLLGLQAWFPAHAEIWNAPTWFLSALTFAMLVLPHVLPAIAAMRKKGLKLLLVRLPAVRAELAFPPLLALRTVASAVFGVSVRDVLSAWRLLSTDAAGWCSGVSTAAVEHGTAVTVGADGCAVACRCRWRCTPVCRSA